MNLTSTELLQTIEKRGARVTLATGDNGAMKLQIAPNGLVTDLVSDIREHARALRELIQSLSPRWSEPPTAATPAVAAPSAIAPDVMPAITSAEGAALLSRYRRAGAILTLERVNGAPALGVELPAHFSPDKRERAFEKIERDGLAIFRALELQMSS